MHFFMKKTFNIFVTTLWFATVICHAQQEAEIIYTEEALMKLPDNVLAKEYQRLEQEYEIAEEKFLKFPLLPEECKKMHQIYNSHEQRMKCQEAVGKLSFIDRTAIKLRSNMLYGDTLHKSGMIAVAMAEKAAIAAKKAAEELEKESLQE